MKYIFIIAGSILVLISLVYFAKLIYYLINDYAFTNYGYGILVGRTILFFAGVLLVYFGIKRKKKKPE